MPCTQMYISEYEIKLRLCQSSFIANMVKILFSVIAAAVAVEDDVTALLQVSAGVRHQVSKGQLILAAVSKDSSKETICVKAAAGDVAPITGSFTAKMSQQAVEVAVGSVAQEAGSFCVPTQDVLLLQRTLGLATAQDFEAALGRKGETAATATTTTKKYVRYTKANEGKWDFGEDAPTDLAAVEQCPSAASLLQTMDATVSKKKEAAPLTNDQKRVCSCRKALEEMSEGLWNYTGTDAGAAQFTELVNGHSLLQSLDGALSKKGEEGRTPKQKQMLAFKHVTCHQATDTNTATWESVAKGLNNEWLGVVKTQAKIGDKKADVTHCDQGWVLKSACSEILKEPDMLKDLDKDSQATIKIINAAAKVYFTAHEVVVAEDDEDEVCEYGVAPAACSVKGLSKGCCNYWKTFSSDPTTGDVTKCSSTADLEAVKTLQCGTR